jgi:hypothetical protein
MMAVGWVITGIILLGTMITCAIILYLKRREQNLSLDKSDNLKI